MKAHNQTVMNKLLSLLAMLIFVSCSTNDYSTLNESPDWVMYPLLKLHIAPYKKYEVVGWPTNATLKIGYFDEGKGYKWDDVSAVNYVPLTELEYQEISQLLEEAIQVPLIENAPGPDGVTWILESSLYRYNRYAVWMPSLEPIAYKPLLALSRHLDILEANANENES